MLINKDKVNRILFITLSNIGDCILTLPVLDALRKEFPKSLVDVMVGPRPEEIFQDNPTINRLIIYDKHSRIKDKLNLIKDLRRQRYDLVVDLRNSAFPLLINARHRTTPFIHIPKNILHMRDRHLYRLNRLISYPLTLRSYDSLWISHEDNSYIDSILQQNQITPEDKLVVIAAGARSHIKRWSIQGFSEVVLKFLKETKVKIIFVGDSNDKNIVSQLLKVIKCPEILKDRLIDLGGRTNLKQLAALLKKVDVLITNDSAVMHLGSYLNRAVVALFGPTDPKKYGPWSDNYTVIRSEIICSPCEIAQCKFNTLECMRLINSRLVFERVLKMLDVNYKPSDLNYKRILIMRTDRIGDVVLTTPMIKELRDAWPNSYIAIMVSPSTFDIVKDNPYLDEVIVYDKKVAQHGLWQNIKFIRMLKEKRFELALVLHTKNRINLIAYLAGIRERIGYYNNKFGFLLTKKIPDTRPQGLKHESQYCLDILRHLGIEPKDGSLFIPISKEQESWAEDLLKKDGLAKEDLLIAIHPGASCPSKMWPAERFADISKKLIQDYKAKIILLGGQETDSLAERMLNIIQQPILNLAGRLSIGQLASILRRCKLLISNDSGPVHIAVGVSTPVISIFGRNESGLSPVRWRPLGKNDIVLHKDVGCKICQAHNCKIYFACLKAITQDDVLEAIDKILKS